jgi:hypothetical protein
MWLLRGQSGRGWMWLLRGQNGHVIDKAELRRMSPAERRRLARDLADLDVELAPAPAPALDLDLEQEQDLERERAGGRRLQGRRRVALLVVMGCCVFLAFWIVVLAATLPRHFDAHRWRGVWVQFDIGLLAVFLATAWAVWRERQIIIMLLTIVGTMLCCDAWFDVGTSFRTSSFKASILSAVLAELPLAFLAFAGARRLLAATVAAGLRAPGAPAPVGGRGLRHIPLFGKGLDDVIPGRARRHAGPPPPPA